ncbi:hypothetical protein ACP4OV_007356 [Aristida adscensionis]
MDLKFWSIIQVTRDPRHRAKRDVKNLQNYLKNGLTWGIAFQIAKM